METDRGPAGRIKLAEGKTSYPFAKQVYRRAGADGVFRGDVVARDGEPCDGEPLLAPVLRQRPADRPVARRRGDRTRCRRQLEHLPAESLGWRRPRPTRCASARGWRRRFAPLRTRRLEAVKGPAGRCSATRSAPPLCRPPASDRRLYGPYQHLSPPAGGQEGDAVRLVQLLGHGRQQKFVHAVDLALGGAHRNDDRLEVAQLLGDGGHGLADALLLGPFAAASRRAAPTPSQATTGRCASPPR